MKYHNSTRENPYPYSYNALSLSLYFEIKNSKGKVNNSGEAEIIILSP